MLRIQLLGSFQVSDDTKPLAKLQADRLQALLAYLVLHRDQPLSRQQLAVTFWPDTTDAQARTNLRTLITRLREALPNADRCFSADAQTVQWRTDAPCAIDVIEFEQALATNGLTEAITLYRGDLLPACYDDWITGERERLRQAYQHALDRLITRSEKQGRFDQAIAYAQRLLRHDPLHETTYRHLMRLQLASGDRSGALRTYHACATMLRDELGVEPAAETRAVYAQLLKVESPVVEAAMEPVRALFMGRQTEWAQLLAIWRTASAGRPQLVLITGEGGHRQDTSGRASAGASGSTRCHDDYGAELCHRTQHGLRTDQPVAASRGVTRSLTRARSSLAGRTRASRRGYKPIDLSCLHRDP